MTAIIDIQFCLLLADTMYASYHHTDASGHVLQGTAAYAMCFSA